MVSKASSSNKKRLVKRKVINLTEGVLEKVVDLVLVSIYFGFEASFAGYGRTWMAGRKVEAAYAELNYQTIKRAVRGLVEGGYIQQKRGDKLLPKITNEGKQRLKGIIPQYNHKRTWDGKIYLVTYDLPRKKNYERNLLRSFLRRIGCGMLQYSVWITPYNPKKLIEEFVQEHRLEGNLILVSSLGRGGAIGDVELPDLLDKVYDLSELNKRYGEFIEVIRTRKIYKGQAIFSYLSILRDDPQLPFDLLGKDWQGDRAYRLLKLFVKRGIVIK